MCRHEVCTLALALVHGNLEPLVHLWAAVHVHLDVDVDRHVRVLLHGICLLTDLLGRLSGICLLTNLLGRLSGMLLRIPAATTVATPTNTPWRYHECTSLLRNKSLWTPEKDDHKADAPHSM